MAKGYRKTSPFLFGFPKVLKLEEEGPYFTVFPSCVVTGKTRLSACPCPFCFADFRENKVFMTNIGLLCTFLLYQRWVNGGFIFQL